MSPEPLYDLDASRLPEQRAQMEHLEAERICVFCPEFFASHHEAPMERSGEYWYVTRNDYPYEGTLAHYLVVPHAHVTSFDELPDEAGAELWAMKRWIRGRHDGAAVATVERSGDMRFNGGSVAHLHTHVVVLPELPTATVRFRLSAHAADGPG